jgi:hypothetical protein
MHVEQDEVAPNKAVLELQREERQHVEQRPGRAGEVPGNRLVDDRSPPSLRAAFAIEGRDRGGVVVAFPDRVRDPEAEDVCDIGREQAALDRMWPRVTQGLAEGLRCEFPIFEIRGDPGGRPGAREAAMQCEKPPFAF